MYMKKYFLPFLIVLLLVFQNSHKSVSKITLQFNGKPNDTFAYSIVTESLSSQNRMGDFSESSTDFLINYEFQVQSVNDSNVFTIKGTIKKIIFSVNTGKEEITFNSDKADNNDEGSIKVFKRLLNTDFIFQVNNKGVSEVTGLNTKINKIFSIVKLPGNVNQKQLVQFIFGTFGNAATAQRLNYIFYYPDKEIYSKEKWKEENKEEGVNVKMNYKVGKIKKGIVKIVAEGTSNITKDMSKKGGKTTYIISFTGTMDMEFNIDSKTGLMITANVHNKQEGTININGGNSNMTIPSTNEETTTVTKL